MEKFKVLILAGALLGATVAEAETFPYTCVVSGSSTSPATFLLQQDLSGVGATAETATAAALSACQAIFPQPNRCDLISCSNDSAPPAYSGSFVYDGTGVAGDDPAGAAAQCQLEANKICARTHKHARAVSPFQYFGENGDDQCTDWSDANTCTSVYYTYAEGTFICN